MAKKIIDIVPVEREGKEERLPQIVTPKKEKAKKEKRPKGQPDTGGRRFSFSVFSPKPLIIVGVVIVVLVGVFFASRVRLTLYIESKQEAIEFQEEIKIATSQTLPDVEAKVIPGRIFEAREEKWDIFQSTGTDIEGEKARGIIKVYNAHNPPSPIGLKEQTRFLSSEDGKIFRAPEKLRLSAAKLVGGKIVPSVTEVEVIAQEAGEDYNVGPSKFSVPGLVGSALYYTVWGESEKNMEGGFKKEVKKVSKDDLERAEYSLKEQLKETAKKSLKNQLPENFVLEDKAIFEEGAKVTCFQEKESQVAEFNCQGEITFKGLAFDRKDLEDVVYHFVAANLSAAKKLVPRSLSLELSPQSMLTNEGNMIFGIKIKGKTYEELNQVAFLSQISGKTEEEITTAIPDSYPEIADIEFKFWPFWAKKAPKEIDNIKIVLTF